MSRRTSRSSAAAAAATDDSAMDTAPAAAASAAPKKRARSTAKPAAAAADESDDELDASRTRRGPKRRHTNESNDAPAAAAAAAAAAAEAAASSEENGDVDAPMDCEEQHDDDDNDGDGENATAIAASLGLSLYEYQRQQNIKLKNEQLQLLDLAGLSGDLGLKTRVPAPKTSKPRVKREPQVGTRRSSRSIVVDPNYKPPAPIYTPDMTLGKDEDRRPRRVGILSHDEALPTDKSKLTDAERTQLYDDVLGTFQLILLRDDEHKGQSAEDLVSDALDRSYRKSGCIAASKLKMLGDPTNSKIIKNTCRILKIHPTASLSTKYTVLAAADKFGHVSLARYENDVTPAKWSASVQAAEYDPHTDSVVDLHFSNIDSHVLYSASRDGSARKFDIEARQFTEVFIEDAKKGAGVSCMGMMPDQSTLLVGDRDGYIHWIDVREGGTKAARSRSRVGSKALNSCVVSPLDSNLLVTGGLDRVVRAWDRRKIVENKPLAEWSHTGAINSVAFSPEGTMLASTAKDDTIKIWSCASASGSRVDPSDWTSPRVIRHNNQTGQWVTRFRAFFSPASAALAIGSMQRAIDVWSLSTSSSSSAKKVASKKKKASSSTKKRNTTSKRAAAAAGGSDSDEVSSDEEEDDTPLPPPTLGSELHLHNVEWCTTIPAVVAWHPTRVQIVGCTGSGRLYVYGQ